MSLFIFFSTSAVTVGKLQATRGLVTSGFLADFAPVLDVFEGGENGGFGAERGRRQARASEGEDVVRDFARRTRYWHGCPEDDERRGRGD